MTEKTGDLIADAREHVPYAGSQDDDWCIHCADEWPCVTRRLADALEAATLERDAALAAVERVREIHQLVNTQSQYPMLPDMKPMKLQVCSHCKRPGAGDALHPWPCPTVAALDGAPEPEWEYARERRYGGVCEPDDSREHAEYRAALGGGYDTVVRRRPAGPWLPVEGESNGA